MTQSPFKTYLFSYDFHGNRFGFEIPAASAEEARLRLMQMQTATYDGELVMSISVPSRPLQRLLEWWGAWRLRDR